MRQAIKIGLMGGVVEVLLSLIGMIEAFSQRDIISHVISMGHTLLLLVVLFMAYLVAKRTPRTEPLWVLINGFLSGLIIGGFLAGLVLLGSLVPLRKVFINASPLLYKLLTFDQEMKAGVPLLLGSGAISGLFASLLCLAPSLPRRILIISLGSVVGAGVLQDLLRPTFSLWGPLAVINEWLFTPNGLTFHGAFGFFSLIVILSYFLLKKRNTIRAAV